MEEKSSSDSWQLIKATNCKTTCLSLLTENDVLSDEDVMTLECIPMALERSRKLFRPLSTKIGWYPHLIAALEEDCQSGALHILNKLGGEDAVAKCFGAPKIGAGEKPPIRFDVMAPVFNFTGREAQLRELHRKLQENIDKRAVISHMTSIVGLGGIGKTELARKYIQVYGDDCYQGNVIWISAQSEDTLSKSFRKLATDYLKMSFSNGEPDIKTLVDRVYRQFNEQKVLFVFDNAESTEYFQKFMPLHLQSSFSSPYILLTSRDSDWSFGTEVLELDEMTEKDAICFVKTSLQMENDDEVLKLVNRLQRYPLALSQAISFIKQRRKIVRNFSISQYLQKLEENSKKLLDCKRSPAEFNTYRETTLTTWRVTTQQISADQENGRCSMEILNSMAYFLPEKIPIKVFAYLSEGGEHHEALLLLVKYSMIRVQHEDETVSVHRLVQEVTRIQHKMNNQEKQALTSVLQLVSSCISDEFREDVKIVYHALSAYKFSCVLCPELSIKFKTIPYNIMGVLRKNCKYEEVQLVGEEMESLLAKFVPEGDCELIRVKLLLLNVAFVQLENLEANLKVLKTLRQQVYENTENSFRDDEITAVDRLLLDYLREVDCHKEALEFSVVIFSRLVRLYGLNSLRTNEFLIDYAKCISRYSTLSVLGEVEQVYLKNTLSGIFKHFRELHSKNLDLIGKNANVTKLIAKMARFLSEIGELKSAATLVNDVIERATNFSDISGLRILISCLNTQSYIKLRERKFHEVLAINKNIHARLVSWKGEMDPATLDIKEKIALTLLLLCDLEPALKKYTELLKILKNEKVFYRPLLFQSEFLKFVRGMKSSKNNLQKLEGMIAQMETEFGDSHPLMETVRKQIELFSREK